MRLFNRRISDVGGANRGFDLALPFIARRQMHLACQHTDSLVSLPASSICRDALSIGGREQRPVKLEPFCARQTAGIHKGKITLEILRTELWAVRALKTGQQTLS
ncbi:MAG TPA: hypothetical protein VN887_00270 [Candidatus Angelobacter sp.]|nr:hypothetical protein [Candidatus Angelobacter sp.]